MNTMLAAPTQSSLEHGGSLFLVIPLITFLISAGHKPTVHILCMFTRRRLRVGPQCFCGRELEMLSGVRTGRASERAQSSGA